MRPNLQIDRTDRTRSCHESKRRRITIHAKKTSSSLQIIKSQSCYSQSFFRQSWSLTKDYIWTALGATTSTNLQCSDSESLRHIQFVHVLSVEGSTDSERQWEWCKMHICLIVNQMHICSIVNQENGALQADTTKAVEVRCKSSTTRLKSWDLCEFSQSLNLLQIHNGAISISIPMIMRQHTKETKHAKQKLKELGSLHISPKSQSCTMQWFTTDSLQCNKTSKQWKHEERAHQRNQVCKAIL